jgi:hypothetical protein
LAANAALLARLQQTTATPATVDQQRSIPADATPATEGGKAVPEPPIDLLDDDTEPTASEFVDFASYGEVIPAGLERPPRDVEEPRLWTLTNDTARCALDDVFYNPSSSRYPVIDMLPRAVCPRLSQRHTVRIDAPLTT